MLLTTLMSPKKGDYMHLNRDGSSMVYAPQGGWGGGADIYNLTKIK